MEYSGWWTNNLIVYSRMFYKECENNTTARNLVVRKVIVENTSVTVVKTQFAKVCQAIFIVKICLSKIKK